MKLDEIAKEKYELFLDIDGVFADFEKGVEKLTGQPHEETKYDTDPKYKKAMWAAVNKYREEGGELWYELELLPDAMELWDYAKKYNPTFLTATGVTARAKTMEEKGRWLDEKFGKDIPRIMVPSAGDKHKHAKKNRILIDDKKKALDPWIKAGGIGILHTSASDTIKQLKDLGLE